MLEHYNGYKSSFCIFLNFVFVSIQSFCVCIWNSLINFSLYLFLHCFMLSLRQGAVWLKVAANSLHSHALDRLICLPPGSGIISSDLLETWPSEHFIEITSDTVKKSCILLVSEAVFHACIPMKIIMYRFCSDDFPF